MKKEPIIREAWEEIILELLESPELWMKKINWRRSGALQEFQTISNNELLLYEIDWKCFFSYPRPEATNEKNGKRKKEL